MCFSMIDQLAIKRMFSCKKSVQLSLDVKVIVVRHDTPKKYILQFNELATRCCFCGVEIFTFNLVLLTTFFRFRFTI